MDGTLGKMPKLTDPSKSCSTNGIFQHLISKWQHNILEQEKVKRDTPSPLAFKTIPIRFNALSIGKGVFLCPCQDRGAVFCGPFLRPVRLAAPTFSDTV